MILFVFVIGVVLLLATAKQVEEFSWDILIIRATIFVAFMYVLFNH